MNNKGFSLVELIVVIAIMAVLVGILAPQFLRYVEKSRCQKDNTALSEIANACKTAAADEQVYSNLPGEGETLAFASNTLSLTGGGENTVKKDVNATIGDSVVLTSNTYKDKNPIIKVKASTSGNGLVEVTVSTYYSKPGATAETNKVF